MSITKFTVYTVKLIDELGNCYHEENITGYSDRQKYIKEWLKGDSYSYSNVADVTCVVKVTGEELWYYECKENFDA